MNKNKLEEQTLKFLQGFKSSLFHGTTLENHLLIKNSNYIGWDYNSCKGVYLTDDFKESFFHGPYIYEFDLPFQNNLIKMIPNTDSGERELWLNFFIPKHRVKKVWIPNIDYDLQFMYKWCDFH